MYAISISWKTSKQWKTYPTPSARDEDFSNMKKKASVTGCGPQCGCFRDNGKSFSHCGGQEISIIDNLSMKD